MIEHREALMYMLCLAAELEHSIMCEYLFAAFTLKQRADEGLSEQELAAVLRWRGGIAHVASQEMLHLALVQNLLSAVGGAPHLGRPNLPQPARHYPPGIVLALVPFGEQALRHFMFLERPEGMDLPDAESLGAVGDASAAADRSPQPLLSEDDIVPRRQDFATVGHLYRSIEAGLQRLSAKYGEQALFVGPAAAQATAANFHWPQLVAVTDLASAQRAIDTILEQGEGARGDWQPAHFGQFVEILAEYQQMRQANPAFEPARPVLAANVRACEHAVVPLIGDALTAQCADLFNVGYEVLLQTLERYFAHTEESEAQLATLATGTLSLMLRVLKPLGDLLTTLPVDPDRPGMTAAPSFELFYESDYLMPHRAAAWALLEERLREAAVFNRRIASEAGAALAATLDPVGRALDEIADGLAAHFGDWGEVSRYRTGGPVGTPGDAPATAALLRRATELVHTAASARPTDPGSRRLLALFNDVHLLLSAVVGGDAGSRGANDQQLAGRLVDSVLGPLGAAVLSSCNGGDGGDGVASPAGPARTISIEPGTVQVRERLWLLALDATRTLASFRGAPDVQGALAQATAGLQDLAIADAPAHGPDGSAARFGQLATLQAGQPTGISVTEGGPYLLTNVPVVQDWLGQPVATTPTMALCRCGESAIKPVCDGACARTGFTGGKDPNRVADRRDSYVGQQVGVLDNRGICQHSGLCTDQLASVFQLGQEPFVHPSGGRMDEIIRAVRDCPSGALSYALDGIEAREHVDHTGRRGPVIEVSKDGPYRVSGGIGLVDQDGQDVPRDQGASREHYALCRCGHSRNKPFCSGMHWYVNFHDPAADPQQTPTMFQWCGGLPALTRMTRLFYETYVPADPLLAPLFADMSPEHPQRLATWLAEVFGGPAYDRSEPGGSAPMITQQGGSGLTEQSRARWVALLSQCAQQAGLPDDPQFRAAFTGYLEWASRQAVENSHTSTRPPQPMPRWDWGPAGPPRRHDTAISAAPQPQPPAVPPTADEVVRYDKHIKPLFREQDRQSMTFAFDLWSYPDVRTHADAILTRLRNGSMPCDGAWPPEQIDVFSRWIAAGTPT